MISWLLFLVSVCIALGAMQRVLSKCNGFEPALDDSRHFFDKSDKKALCALEGRLVVDARKFSFEKNIFFLHGKKLPADN